MNNKIINLFFFVVFFLTVNCSFDNTNKSRIWSGGEDEKKKALDIFSEQNKELVNIYSSSKATLEEVKPIKNITLNSPKKNNSWRMEGKNLQNLTGNIYLTGINNNFLKKKIGKNKFKISKVMASPLVLDDNIIISDDTGSIFNINKRGKLRWKRNIYKKIYKKLYKKLSLFIDKETIYVSDNIGFIYAINLLNGKIIWIKNQDIPIKSHIKVFNEKIFVINQENKILCLDAKNGAQIWSIRTIDSFIKLQNFLGLAISQKGDLVALTSTGDLLKINSSNGAIYWSLSATATSFAHDNDFFNLSDIIITDEEVVFFASDSIFSFNLSNGYLNWRKEIFSENTPIIDGNNIFVFSNNGYFLNLEKNTGKTIWSTNILKILKKKKQNTKITGSIMGSGKIYVVTKNGFLIICSASSGKVESFKKIGKAIIASPVISNASLYVLTENSRILGFN